MMGMNCSKVSILVLYFVDWVILFWRISDSDGIKYEILLTSHILEALGMQKQLGTTIVADADASAFFLIV